MLLDISNARGGSKAPWLVPAGTFLKTLRPHLAWNAMVLGVFNPRRIDSDAMLVADGVDRKKLAAWCEGGVRSDELFKEARRRRIATGRSTTRRSGTPLPAAQHVTISVLRASAQSRALWYLAMGHRRRGYDEQAQRRAALLLQVLKAEFDHVAERDLGRLFLDDRGRLVLADPRSAVRFVERPEVLKDLTKLMPKVVAQRWGKLGGIRPHDMALSLAGAKTWVRARQAGVGPAGCGGAYVELRPLDRKDVPAVGPVDDDRVARAMGYMSDHYDKAPGLIEVAEVAGASPFHFHRLFSRQAGISPKHYALRTQLQMAKWMLRATAMPIGDVGVETGFASHGHFTATFHRMVGRSPSDYRS